MATPSLTKARQQLQLAEADCIAFLQWALPQLHMRWRGFRRVRAQVCKRLKQRLQALALPSIAAYRDYLTRHPQEWSQLDQVCRITISRFYRDSMMFDCLQRQILPQLTASLQPPSVLRAWSAGCASGEEAYSLQLLWQFAWAEKFPQLGLQILATDIDETLLARAQAACYPFSSIKRLPEAWRVQAFEQRGEEFCLRQAFQQNIEFRLHDIRQPLQAAAFHLIFCRNLAFTYYDAELQQRVLESLHAQLHAGGFLILGAHERLEPTQTLFQVYNQHLSIYQKAQA